MLTAATETQTATAKKQDVARAPPLCRSLSPELSRPTEGDGRRSQLAHARTDGRTDGSLLSEHVNGAPGAVGRFARTARVLSLARGGGYRGEGGREGDCGSSNSR